MSLIYTAEFSAVDPFEYLDQLLKHIEDVRRNRQQWMPWNYQTAGAAAGTATTQS